MTQDDFKRFVAELSEGGAAPAYVRTIMAVVCRWLSEAVLQGHLNRHPAKGVPLPKVAPRENRLLTPDEWPIILKATDRIGVAACLAALTGLRRGELLALDWGHVFEDRIGAGNENGGVEGLGPFAGTGQALFVSSDPRQHVPVLDGKR